MSMQFGPQLIGQTEKALNALLRRFLEGEDLTESQWVTLRLAGQVEAHDPAELVSAIASQSFLAEPSGLVAGLTERGLLTEGRISVAGTEMVARVQARIREGEQDPPIWDDLDSDDVAATTRVLNAVLTRTRANLQA